MAAALEREAAAHANVWGHGAACTRRSGGRRRSLAARARAADDRGARFDERSDEATAELLEWMLKKSSLGEDMLLLGDPGPSRQLVHRWCEACNREVEYVAVTRDTCGSDLKQRRELSGRSSGWASPRGCAAVLAQEDLDAERVALDLRPDEALMGGKDDDTAPRRRRAAARPVRELKETGEKRREKKRPATRALREMAPKCGDGLAYGVCKVAALSFRFDAAVRRAYDALLRSRCGATARRLADSALRHFFDVFDASSKSALWDDGGALHGLPRRGASTTASTICCSSTARRRGPSSRPWRARAGASWRPSPPATRGARALPRLGRPAREFSGEEADAPVVRRLAPTLAASRRDALSAMVADHCAGLDLFVCGTCGGKSALQRTPARRVRLTAASSSATRT
ncbi:ATPase [Aureococcus anophagefferens]|nr:ATPase [Aureococcus anophagefferens]